ALGGAAGILQGPVEVVERGEQLIGQLDDPALLGGGRLLCDPLAGVLKVRLRPLRERQVLIALRGEGYELIDVSSQRLLVAVVWVRRGAIVARPLGLLRAILARLASGPVLSWRC